MHTTVGNLLLRRARGCRAVNHLQTCRFFSSQVDRAFQLAQAEFPRSCAKLSVAKETQIPTHVVFLSEEETKTLQKQQFVDQSKVDEAMSDGIFDSVAAQDFKGKSNSVKIFYPSKKGERLLLVGLGKKNKITVDKLREATHTAIAAVKKRKLRQVAIHAPQIPEIDEHTTLQAISRTAILSNHFFDKYLTKKENEKVWIEEIDLITESCEEGDSDLKNSVGTSQIIAEGTVLARELAQERADVANPQYFQDVVEEISKVHNLKVSSIVGCENLEDEGLRMLKAVGQAAKCPPRLICVEYMGDPENPDEKIALVGKGITFDTGGLNLKPTGAIETMHYDKGGASAVVGALKSIVTLKLQKNVIFVVALAENSIDANSYKPHEYLKSLKGDTVEVGNTDAEGRLVLADAMTYVQNVHKPKSVIDIATLTGAAVVAFGEYLAGVFANDDLLSKQLVNSGKSMYERCWHMPILQEHSEELKGTHTDIKSTGVRRFGGACTAAAFLKNFVDEDVKWAHLDIAGPAMYSKQRYFMPKGATGFGAALLTDCVMNDL